MAAPDLVSAPEPVMMPEWVALWPLVSKEETGEAPSVVAIEVAKESPVTLSVPPNGPSARSSPAAEA